MILAAPFEPLCSKGGNSMALTPSTMLPLGTELPLPVMLERLTPVHGGALDPSDLNGSPVLVLFLCPHCPFVKHIEAEITRLQNDFGDRIRMVGICSNSTRTHPQDGPEGMVTQAQAHGWTFPYLADSEQVVAQTFQAACTPDLYLFDGQHRLIYRGQLDGSRPGNAIPARWQGSARRHRRLCWGGSRASGADPLDRLQHQMASRRGTGLGPLKAAGIWAPWNSGEPPKQD